MKDKVKNNLESAISTMLDACSEAKRCAQDGDAMAVQKVLHALVWGMANASCKIERAMEIINEK